MKQDDRRYAWLHAAFRALAFAVLIAGASAGAGADVPNPRGGPAFGVKYFGATGPYSAMGKGWAEIMISEMASLLGEGDLLGDCKAAVVEVEHRDLVEAEVALQQSPQFDPATRTKPGQFTQLDYVIEGTLTTGEDGVSWDLQIRNVHTNEVVATDRGHMDRDGDWLEVPVAIMHRLVSPVCGKKPPERSTWTVTRLAPYDEGPPAPGLYTLTVEMNKLRFDCGKPDPESGVGCEPLGSFTVTSRRGPSDGACSVHMEPSTLKVDVDKDAGRGYLQLADYTDPKRDQEPGDYVAVVYVEWTAAEVCEKTGPNPCPCAGARTEQAMGRYVLLTGNAGTGKVTRDMKFISGRCAPAGGNQYGGACTGDKPVFEWTMTR